MGNYASCALVGPQGKKNKGAKVIIPSGEIKQFDQPTKVAELMLEFPNYFLINSKSLQLGKRFNALNADEDLEIGVVYVMFPMQRLNSFVNTADMAALYLAAKRGAHKVIRVAPELDAPQTKEELEGVEEELSEFQHRRSFCRSKKPLLETIVEEVVKSR
ncbi:uncharacterized protein LOC141641509 [Silene latifolia]|uniref:uncharacterized protein LOC141641509 n=1 Tax=Silene latifolia TaxID=37657 RepID=UPI003D7792CC